MKVTFTIDLIERVKAYFSKFKKWRKTKVDSNRPQIILEAAFEFDSNQIYGNGKSHGPGKQSGGNAKNTWTEEKYIGFSEICNLTSLEENKNLSP